MASKMGVSTRFTNADYFSSNPWLEYVFVLSGFLAQVLTLANTTSPLVQLSAITDHYGASPLERNWFQASFSLSTGSLILMSGRIGDVFGLKKTALYGYLWSSIWTILVGVSYFTKNIKFYILCRAFQGSGIAFVLPNLMGIAGRIYQPGIHRKNMVFSLIGMGAPLGGVTGTLFSGLITVETRYFCWTYFAAAIAMIIAMLLTWWSVPDVPLLSDHVKSVDWIGCGLCISGLVLLDFTVNHAPVAGWNTPYVIALLVVSVLLLAIFVWYEVHIPKFPLIPASLMRSPRILLILTLKSLAWGSFGILYFHYFTFLMDFRGYNPLEAGASQAHALFFGSLAAVAVGYAIRHVPIHILLLLSMACFLGASIMQTFTPVHQTYWAMTFPTWILSTTSTDLSFPSGAIILSENLPHECQGMAGSLINTVVNYSNSFFLGLATTIENECGKLWPDDKLRSWRAAMYFSVALAGAAFILAALLTIIDMWRRDIPSSLPPVGSYSNQQDDDDDKSGDEVKILKA